MRCERFRSWRAWLLLPILTATGSADLDIGVTPGGSLEWLRDIPTVDVARDRARVPVRRGFRGETTLAGDPPRRVLSSVNNLYSFLRIITQDLPWEMDLTRKSFKQAPPVVETGTGQAVRISYPPLIAADTYWLALGGILRGLLHPASAPESEIEQFLITLGEPAAAVCRTAEDIEPVAELCRRVVTGVGEIPASLPNFHSASQDALARMLHRLVAEDLLRGYPYAILSTFCARIRLLAEEVLPQVIAASGNAHPLLRRNAVFFLGRLGDPRAQERLREIFATTSDVVCRNRALEGLVRLRDPASAPVLLKRLEKEKDERFLPFLIQGIGVVGGEGASERILGLARRPVSYETLLASVIALGRLGKNSDDVRRFLASIPIERFADPDPAYPVVFPDPPGTRRRTLQQAILAVKAMYGWGDSRRLLLREAGIPPRDFRGENLRKKYGITRGILSGLEAGSVHVVLEALARWSEGRLLLKKIVLDEREDPALRAYALYQYASGPLEKEFVAGLARLEAPVAVAELALRILLSKEPSMAAERAASLAARYESSLSYDRKHLVAVSLQILGQIGGNDRELLARVIREETIARRRKPPVPPVPGWDRAAGSWDPRTFSINLSPVPPLLEQAVVELGRIGTKSRFAREILQEVLETRSNPARAEACLALGGVGSVRAYECLLDALLDEDGWVRFMAYRALRHAAGIQLDVDWLYGSAGDFRRARQEFEKWLDGWAR